jgi:DNA (cytosine-5)-methyltransferase 1
MALFAGLGGFMAAAEQLGLRNVFANEFDTSACKILRLNYPKIKVCEKDIVDVQVADYAELNSSIDMLTAGFPCQSFSNAGENKGFDDPRGKLFFEIPRICKELKKPPKILVLENVGFLKEFDKGSRLATVINELRRAGYWVSDSNAQILDSYDVGGGPQTRRRLFIIAVHIKYFKKNNFDFRTVGKEKSKGLFEVIDRSSKGAENLYLDANDKYFRMIDDLAVEKGKDRLFQIRRSETRACPKGKCPTLTANMGGGGHNVPFVFDEFGLRKLSLGECLRFQGFASEDIQIPDGVSNGAIYQMIGNAVHVPTVKNLLKAVIKTFL